MSRLPPNPPRVLIAVVSCWKDKASGAHQAIRDTWGKDLPPGWDLRFFMGCADTLEGEVSPKAAATDPPTVTPLKLSENIIGTPLPDEIVVTAGDAYLSLPWKVNKVFEYALVEDYSAIIKCDTDVYLFPKLISQSVLTDFAGMRLYCGKAHPAHPGLDHLFPSGGCYGLSRRAMEAAVSVRPTHWNEDGQVGFACHMARIPFEDDERFRWEANVPLSWNKSKFCRVIQMEKWEPKQLLLMHKELTSSKDKYPNWDGRCAKCSHTHFRRGLYGPACRHCGYAYVTGPKLSR